MSKPHVSVLSKTAFILLEADKEFMAPLSSTHTVRSYQEDLDKMIQVILDGDLVTEQPGRRIQGPTFVDPRRKGLVKIESGWIAKFLQEELLSEEEHHEDLQNGSNEVYNITIQQHSGLHPLQSSIQYETVSSERNFSQPVDTAHSGVMNTIHTTHAMRSRILQKVDDLCNH